MDSKGAKNVANVVANRLAAEMQIAGDLLGRTSKLEHVQDLGLPRCQSLMRLCGRGFALALDLPEHPHDALPADHRGAAALDAHAIAGHIDEHELVIADRLLTGHRVRHQLAPTPPVLGGHDRRERVPADVAETGAGRQIEPTNDAALIHDVTRDANRLQRRLDLVAD